MASCGANETAAFDVAVGRPCGAVGRPFGVPLAAVAACPAVPRSPGVNLGGRVATVLPLALLRSSSAPSSPPLPSAPSAAPPSASRRSRFRRGVRPAASSCAMAHTPRCPKESGQPLAPHSPAAVGGVATAAAAAAAAAGAAAAAAAAAAALIVAAALAVLVVVALALALARTSAAAARSRRDGRDRAEQQRRRQQPRDDVVQSARRAAPRAVVHKLIRARAHLLRARARVKGCTG